MQMVQLRCRLSCVWLLILIVAVSTSCNRNDAKSGAVDTAHSEHEHFPAHWPGTIFVAAERLVALKGDRDQLTNKEGVSLERELVDLIRWLPELTADSDLKEADFDQIDSWSSRYAPILESKQNEGGQIEAMLAVEGIGDAIEKLQRIVQAEFERLAAIEGP